MIPENGIEEIHRSCLRRGGKGKSFPYLLYRGQKRGKNHVNVLKGKNDFSAEAVVPKRGSGSS